MGMALHLEPEVREDRSGKSTVRECHSQIYVGENHSGDGVEDPVIAEIRSCGVKAERKGHVGGESVRAGQQACHLKQNPYIWKEYHHLEVLICT